MQDVPGGTIDSLRIVDSGASMHKIGDIRLRNIVISRRMMLSLMERKEKEKKTKMSDERMWLNEVAKFDQMKNAPKFGCYGF